MQCTVIMGYNACIWNSHLQTVSLCNSTPRPRVTETTSNVSTFLSLSLSHSLHFNGHFPGEPGLAGVCRSKGWWRWWVQRHWTTGAISCAKLQSNHHHQPTNIQFFYRPDALPVAQPTVSKHSQREISIALLSYFIYSLIHLLTYNWRLHRSTTEYRGLFSLYAPWRSITGTTLPTTFRNKPKDLSITVIISCPHPHLLFSIHYDVLHWCTNSGPRVTSDPRRVAEWHAKFKIWKIRHMDRYLAVGLLSHWP